MITKRNGGLRRRLAGTAAVLISAALIYIATGCGTGRNEVKTKAPDKSGSLSAAVTENHRLLTGAELYAINCNRCHPERDPVEWTSPQWQTVLTHMRVRANLPATQANAILEYLQANSGN